MNDAWPSSRPYVIGSVTAWGMFLLGIYAISWGSQDERLPYFALWAIAVLLAASVAGQFAAAYRLIARQDEYIRGITAKRMIAAAGVTITLAVLWGIAEQFLGIPRAPVWFIYPLFWGMFGVVTPLIKSSQP